MFRVALTGKKIFCKKMSLISEKINVSYMIHCEHMATFSWYFSFYLFICFYENSDEVATK